MKLIFILILSLLFSCASRPRPPDCPDATETVTIPKEEAAKIQGNVSQFLTDARIRQVFDSENKTSVWRFSHMPENSVYYLIGLRDGDSIYQTNLGPQTSSINLISDLSGIPSGTTNCLYVKSADNTERIIKILLEKK